MLEELDTYDWGQAFQYTGEIAKEDGNSYGWQNGTADVRRAYPGSNTSVSPFGREDVAELLYLSEGENDEAEWLCVGQLYDRRWFALRAGCDYTGWDCQAGGNAEVADTQEQILRYGLTDAERGRLGVVIS